MIEDSNEIIYREDFATLCNARGVLLAAEIGVDRGFFASDFLARWKGRHLYLIDPYLPYDEMHGDRYADRMMAILATQPHHRRVRFLQMDSRAALNEFEDGHRPFNGFVYIDASHLYENADADIKLWWDQLGPEGILAGHDFDENHPGVMRAVHELERRTHCTVRVTHELHQPSWYVYKTER